MTRPVEKLRGYTIAIITARERDLRRTVADVPRARRAPLRVCAAAGGGARHTRRLPRRCRLLSRRVGGGGRGERTGGRHPASADEAHPPTYPRVRACALPSAVAYKAARRCRMWPRGGASEGGRVGNSLVWRRRPYVIRLRRARLLFCFYSGPRSDAKGAPAGPNIIQVIFQLQPSFAFGRCVNTCRPPKRFSAVARADGAGCFLVSDSPTLRSAFLSLRGGWASRPSWLRESHGG